MKISETWVNHPHTSQSYDALRYDPQTSDDACFECGSRLEYSWQDGGVAWCPGCEVLVYAT